MIAEHLHATPAALALTIADELRAALAERGQATLAISGGKSPIALFEQLREQALDWSHVTVMLVDERCVAHDHADSNTALVRQHLLQGAASAATFVALFDAIPADLSEAALLDLVNSANQRLSTLAFPLDVIVLGMGEDGHTASLFPAAPGLDNALASAGPIAWVRPATAPHARLTLTLPVLQMARHVHLPLSGENKLKVYQEAAKGANPALPISLLLNSPACDVQVWKS
ncbi:6-phosphogluconolactonase [Hydrogenophaga sp. PAMC20947]|uniref:6-phosphogluconolactonase n=1 Tax=Hydrogenophaga sp. PAMC20947 TaxID=2565558 RepID=UPI00109D939D|nr:6-phosphogluconolactonase [Hydrogenophaga sp. PAMC20947]QCB45955.1 6-phosphogluconolactonase [Hydrogenophaga sp. PAMC20947]